MKIWILTLFPEVFESVFIKSIIKRAVGKKLLKIELINIRGWALGKHQQVDDKPYGGGEGMVMMPQPILDALKTIKPRPYTILLSASGSNYTQKKAITYAKKKSLALICGHYEGVDARVEKFVDEIISVGDFILTGGEIPAMLIVDSVTRFIPGSINPLSPQDESYQKGLLEYPQYTHPRVYKGLKIPKILLSGNHKDIQKWRNQERLKRTKKFRPDLFKKLEPEI